MTISGDGPRQHVSLAEARQAPVPAGQRSARMMAHGSMSVRYYAPREKDMQTPHEQDEIYVVAAGSGEFVVDGARVEFTAGDVLFAAAGAEHRFENFSPDFATWVVFYGPEGGETES